MQEKCGVKNGSELEEFAEALGLGAADGDFGLFFVVHFEHVAGFEPGDDFLDVVDVDEEGAMRAPEGVGIEGFVELFEGAVIGSAFEIAGGDGDQAVLNGSEDEIFGVDQEQALLGFDEQLCWRGGVLATGAELIDELFEAIGGGGLSLEHFSCAGDGFGEARFVERLEDVVDGADFEGLHGVLIEGGGEDHVGNFHFALDELFEDAETIEAGHFYVEENEVGDMFFDESDGFDSIFAFGDQIDFGKALEQESEFFSRGFFVVNDEGIDVHKRWPSIGVRWSPAQLQERFVAMNRR